MAATQFAKIQYFNDSGAVAGAPDLVQLVNPGGSVAYAISAGGGELCPQAIISASGAVNPRFAEDYVITKAGIAALTLAAPTAGVDDGTTITIVSNTAFAHSITATGLLQTGTAAVNSVTFPVFAGAFAVFIAYQGKWNLQIPANGVYTLA